MVSLEVTALVMSAISTLVSTVGSSLEVGPATFSEGAPGVPAK